MMEIIIHPFPYIPMCTGHWLPSGILAAVSNSCEQTGTGPATKPTGPTFSTPIFAFSRLQKQLLGGGSPLAKVPVPNYLATLQCRYLFYLEQVLWLQQHSGSLT